MKSRRRSVLIHCIDEHFLSDLLRCGSFPVASAAGVQHHHSERAEKATEAKRLKNQSGTWRKLFSEVYF